MTGGRLRTFVEPQIVASAVRVSLLVGTMLNFVNQGPALLARSDTRTLPMDALRRNLHGLDC